MTRQIIVPQSAIDQFRETFKAALPGASRDEIDRRIQCIIDDALNAAAKELHRQAGQVAQQMASDLAVRTRSQ